MQINLIGNTNFGLKISPEMENLFKEGRQYVMERNSRSVKPWSDIKKSIKDMYDYDKFTLIALNSSDNGNNIFLVDPIEGKHFVMNLQSDETIDRSYIEVLKLRLKELEQRFKH